MSNTQKIIKKQLLLNLLIFFFSIQIFAQSVPQAFTYQAIARNNEGIIQGNTEMEIEIVILENNTAVYSETSQVTTNDYGLFTIYIGQKDPSSFSTINWGNGIYTIEVSLDGQVISTTPILAVPYAIVAQTALDDKDKDANNELQDLLYDNNSGLLSLSNSSTEPFRIEGAQGVQGPIGPRGSIGPVGATGATGAKGDRGTQGPAGPAGATGATGTNGADGVNGTTGARGPAGPAGATGATGAKGDTGTNGADGANGATGAQGPAGPAGATGAKGDTGANGADGANGATGAQGPAGPAGPAGATGAAGADCSCFTDTPVDTYRASNNNSNNLTALDAEMSVQERGTSQLKKGEVFISFSEHFKKIMDSKKVTIILTPMSSNTYGLAVTEKNASGFKVKELMNGKGNFNFDWEVKSVLKHYSSHLESNK